MRRIGALGITILLVWALVPGLGEIVENAMHYAREGHAAHAAPSDDHHDPTDPEHGCTGTLHLCSCCVSLSFLPGVVVTELPPLASLPFAEPVVAHRATISATGIDHPPRA